MTEIDSDSVDGWRAIGRVTGVYRHPIKSMAAQALSSAAIDRNGIASAADDAPKRATMLLRAPSGDVISCEGDARSRHFTDAHRVDVELANLRQGMFDIAGLAIITTQTLASLGAMLSLPMDARRFRPNVVIDVGLDHDPFPENAWVGWKLAFGDPEHGPRISVTELDERCAMINLNPDRGLASPEVLRTVVRVRDNFAGVYAVPTRGGRIDVGDVAFARSE